MDTSHTPQAIPPIDTPNAARPELPPLGAPSIEDHYTPDWQGRPRRWAGWPVLGAAAVAVIAVGALNYSVRQDERAHIASDQAVVATAEQAKSAQATRTDADTSSTSSSENPAPGSAPPSTQPSTTPVPSPRADPARLAPARPAPELPQRRMQPNPAPERTLPSVPAPTTPRDPMPAPTPREQIEPATPLSVTPPPSVSPTPPAELPNSTPS